MRAELRGQEGLDEAADDRRRPTPTGAPVCMIAAKRARSFAGNVSPTSVCPVAHSPPTPSPVTTRKRRSAPSPGANPQSSVPSEYVRIVIDSTGLRPKRSAIHPTMTPPTAVAPRLAPSSN